MIKSNPVQSLKSSQSSPKSAADIWDECIAKAKRAELNDNAADFLKHLNAAVKIDFLKTMKYAMEMLKNPSLSDGIQSSLTASLATRIEPLSIVDPALARMMFLAINRITGSGMLRARLRRIAPRIGMGPAAEQK